jgi:hypothetical protein
METSRLGAAPVDDAPIAGTGTARGSSRTRSTACGLAGRVEPVADGDLLDRLAGTARELVVDRALRVDALDVEAALASGLTPLDMAETIRHDGRKRSPLVGGEHLTSGVPA